MEEFNPVRLRLARERRGLTKRQLAEAANLTARSITAFESGQSAPRKPTAEALAAALRFPEEFLFGSDPVLLQPETASFRSLSRMTAGQRHAALAAGALAHELMQWIESRFTLPSPQIPDLRGLGPEEAADSLRMVWTLGDAPVGNMVHLLEAKGVRVFSLNLKVKEVDAFSLWVGETPMVFLNMQKTAERGRFDAAHELAHLVLHRHEPMGGKEPEKEADAFAGCFLMPGTSVRAVATRRFVDSRSIHALKKNWRVSALALTRRLHDLGIFTEWRYKSVCRSVSMDVGRTSEKDGIAWETSRLLPKVFAALRADGMQRTDVARELRIHGEDLDALVFGLVMTRVHDDSLS